MSLKIQLIEEIKINFLIISIDLTHFSQVI